MTTSPAQTTPADPAPVTTSAPAAESTTYDPTAPFVQGGKTYIPGPNPTFGKLPGEPGYTPPAD